MARIASMFCVLAVGVSAAACGEYDPTTPLSPAEARFSSSGPVLVECPVDSTLATSGQLGLLGGALELGDHRLALPFAAVLLPTEFGLEAPVSNYMELTIHANGQESFEFEKMVSITIDYSRCTRSNIDKAPLTVWQIDPVTKALLEPMGGEDNKTDRTITFQTDHLSTYSIAQ